MRCSLKQPVAFFTPQSEWHFLLSCCYELNSLFGRELEFRTILVIEFHYRTY